MTLFDIHTHNTPEAVCASIFNSGTVYRTDCMISMGIHPWEITGNWREPFAIILRHACCNNVVAVGECGIDKIKSPADAGLQKEIFRAHAELAEEINKPLIIHCVKAYDEIIAAHKDITPEQPWIIHGFRGKPQQALQLTRMGIYLSLGVHFNPDAARVMPADKLFIESDESNMPLSEIYSQIATARETSTDILIAQIWKNAQIFGQIQK